MREKDRALRRAIDNHLARGVENLQMHIRNELGALTVAAPRECELERKHARLGAQSLRFLLPKAAIHVADVGVDQRLEVRGVEARSGDEEGDGEGNGLQYKPDGR